MKNNYFALVPNNEEGQLTIKIIRQIARRNDWTVSCRGRLKDRKALALKMAMKYDVSKITLYTETFHLSLRRSITIEQADRIAVYVKYRTPKTVFSTYQGKNVTYDVQVKITPAHYLQLLAEGKVK